MGSVQMEELKQSFVQLVRKVTPPQMPQFVIWLDVKLSEYKLNGYMRLDDEFSAGQTWMELFMALPSGETNGNNVKIKEEPPDSESTSSFNVLWRVGESRKSSASDQGNNALDRDNMEDGQIGNTTQHDGQRMTNVDSVSILRSSAQVQTYGKLNDRSRDSVAYSWHRVDNSQPAFPGLIASSQTTSVSSISRPITLMDLKSSANIPKLPSLSGPKTYHSSSQLNSLSELECPLCHKVSKDERAFRRHMSAHRQPSDYPCAQCGRSFSLKMQLRRHNCSANVRHMQRSPTMSPTHPYASPPARAQAHAPYLMSKFKPITIAGQTVQQLSEGAGCASVLKMIACEDCGRRFSRHQDLSRHVCAKPITETPLNVAASNREAMKLLTQLNKNRVSADYPITCTGCGWSFSRRQDLRRHKCSGDIRKLLNKSESSRTTTTESPQPVDTASGGASIESQYDDSAPSSPQPKIKKYEYMCAKCGSNFYTEDELQSHIDKCILEENGNSAHSPQPNTPLVEQEEEDTADVDNAGDESADNDEDDDAVPDGSGTSNGENGASVSALKYQGSGTTNQPTSNPTGLWSVNEDSRGGSNSTSASNNQRQSKRKKAVPQKVETMATSPRRDDTGEGSDCVMDADADVISPDGDVIEVDEAMINEAGTDGQLVLGDSYKKSPSQRVHKGQGRDSDGDTDEEMFFQVNKDGVITWQGSNLSSAHSPASDLGLVSAYQLDQMPGTSQTPAQPDTASDSNTGLLISQIPGAQISSKAATVQGKNKSVAVKKTAKKRRRNNNGPYECKVCHKLFAQSSSRNRHTKLHYGIYDYACDVCGRQFARREHLKTHANKCPGAVGSDNAQQPSTAQSATSTVPTASYSLLQESFGDIIMIQ